MSTPSEKALLLAKEIDRTYTGVTHATNIERALLIDTALNEASLEGAKAMQNKWSKYFDMISDAIYKTELDRFGSVKAGVYANAAKNLREFDPQQVINERK
jgi:hypothetical protein